MSKDQKTNTPQAEVLRFGADNVQLSQLLDRPKEEVAKPHGKRGMKDISQELAWMQMKDTQLGSAATGSGGLGVLMTPHWS